LSEICKRRNVWKLPSPFSMNTLIPCSEKTSWRLKTWFWKKNCPINSKTVMKNFSQLRLPCKSLNLIVLGHPRKNLYSWSIIIAIFEFAGQFFFSKMMFLNSEKSFQNLRIVNSLGTDLKVSRHFFFYRFQTNQRY
jgi:hypothetical protein